MDEHICQENVMRRNGTKYVFASTLHALQTGGAGAGHVRHLGYPCRASDGIGTDWDVEATPT